MKFKKPAAQDEAKSDLYIKIKDGHSLTFTPRGEIHEFYSVFGTPGEVLRGTPGAKLRYKMNVVMSDDGGKTFRVKIYEFGKSIYTQLYEISQVCDVTHTKLRLSRRGSTKEDTEYTLLPMIKEPLTTAMLQAIERVELNILDRGTQPEPPPFDAPMPTEEEMPQDEEPWQGY